MQIEVLINEDVQIDEASLGKYAIDKLKEKNSCQESH
jgi:hypothetical protein